MPDGFGPVMVTPSFPLGPSKAKTVEEKRKWTHHIKRLILDNHHTTIPQKVSSWGCLRGAGSGCPSEPAPGNPGAHLLDTGPPQCCGPLYQPCGGPWCDRAEEEMAHSKVATRWVSFPSRPKKPSWKWIPIVSSPFLPALSLTVLISWSD